MAAITNASRKGIPIAGCTMYVTTFPCHLCARHIVSAGIKRVVYVEPYPKSLTIDLYPDSISKDGEGCDGKRIPFETFVGIAPRQYQNLFTARIRKDKDGKAIKFTKDSAKLRYHEVSEVYKANEVREFKALNPAMRAAGIINSEKEGHNG